MKAFLTRPFCLLLAVLVCVTGCGPRENNEPTAPSRFTVNDRNGNLSLGASASAQTLYVAVYCDMDWTISLEQEAAWVSWKQTVSGTHLWALSIILEENSGADDRQAVLQLKSGTEQRNISIKQLGSDQVVTQKAVGAYGVPGGDQSCEGPSRQSAVLSYGDSFSFRILEPESLTAISVSGLPLEMKEGDLVSLHYRVAVQGITKESRLYEDLSVVHIQDGKAWIKQDESTFFVIKMP